MKKYIKSLIVVLLTIGLVIVFFLFFGYFFLKNELPEYSASVAIKGIHEKVEIYRDENAVPHIFAKSETDAAFAQGYVHAQERFFQMDLIRRAAQGKLSQIFGKKTFKYDKLFRTLQLEKLVKQNYPLLRNDSKQILIAYSKGVNSYIESNKNKLGIEFSLLGYEPEKWKPEHSLLISKMMAWELNISWWTDIVFTELVKKYGDEKAKEILPDFPENAPTIIPKNISSLNDDLMETDIEFREFMGFAANHYGSNNWVVSGKKTLSRKPIIANDPHLVFSIPDKWFVVSIKSPTLNIDGFSLPGVPGIVIGRNDKIAWALTNVMADDCDFYEENVDFNKKEYFYNNHWEKLKSVIDTIFIKDEQPFIFTIFKTHRGPIISSVHNFEQAKKNKQALSMRWTALEFHKEYDAIYGVNKSKNWSDFVEALKDFSTPGQNFVYADEQNIGYICAAKLPIRSQNSSTFICSGTTSENDWKGFVDYDLMPKLFNPASGFIATANNKTKKDFNFHISNLWEPSSRIEQITSRLAATAKIDTSFCFDLQNDFYSVYASRISKHIVSAFENVKIKDKNLRTALSLIADWDYQMDSKSFAATIYSYFYQKLLRNIFYDEMGKELFDKYIFIANVPYRVVEDLLKKNNSTWFDNVNTKKVEYADDIIRKSMTDALDDLEAQYGKDIANWQWGNVHKIQFKHIFSDGSKFLSNIFDNGPFPIGGDGTTVFNTEYTFTNPYKVKLGPSMRFVYDFADKSKFKFILPNGQSGHVMSSHYSDMNSKWLNKKYINMIIEPNETNLRKYEYLELIPDKD
ncbi:MAG: penicillin acylase family protein [Ignavibacteriales bacterium]